MCFQAGAAESESMAEKPDLEEWKRSCRREVRARLAALSGPACETAGLAVCAGVRGLAEWERGRLYAAFVPGKGEPDVRPLLAEVLAAGKLLALPRYCPAERRYEMVAVPEFPGSLVSGAFGIPEPRAGLPPVAAAGLGSPEALWLVPGLAFDRLGRRLGRGGGFYDRLLREVRGVKVGVAFACQMLDEVPAGPHDILVDVVVTEHGIVRCRC